MNFHVPALATHPDSMETSQSPVKRRPDEAPRVLSVENDILLQSSRAQVMERAGCSVHSCTSVEVLNLIRRGRYTVAVFGHCLANRKPPLRPLSFERRVRGRSSCCSTPTRLGPPTFSSF
jgi:hypothetical protein